MEMDKPAREKPGTKRFYVTYKINARFVAAVTANDLEEAKKAAETAYMDADFGEAADIDGEPIIIEDEHGNFVWEK